MAYVLNPTQSRRRIPQVGAPTRIDAPLPVTPVGLPPGAPVGTAPQRTKRDLIPDQPANPNTGDTPITQAPPTVRNSPRPQPPTTTMAPVPKMPPGGTPEGPGFAPPTAPVPPARTPLPTVNVPGASVTPFGPDVGDLRGGFISPAESARAKAAALASGGAANDLATFNFQDTARNNADEYLNRLTVDPLAYNPVGTDVTREQLNPNLNFAGGLETDVTRRAINPNATYRAVGTDVRRAAVDPTIRFNALDTNIAPGDAINPADSDALTRFREMRGNAAEGIASGPSRTEIAQNALKAFDLANQPQLENQIRDVGRQASKFGRIGMGETAVQTLRPFTELQAQRAALEKQLAADTAQGEIQDRLNNLNATQNLVGAEEAFGAGRRAEARGERGYTTDIQNTNIGRAIGERDTALGLEERNRARAAEEANTQAGLAERNLARQASERDAELGVGERNIGRDIGLASEEAQIAAGNLARRATERDTAFGAAERNFGRQQSEADRQAQIAAENLARRAGERNTQLDINRENTARTFDARRAALRPDRFARHHP